MRETTGRQRRRDNAYSEPARRAHLLLRHELDERALLGVDAVLVKLLVREALETVLEEIKPKGVRGRRVSRVIGRRQAGTRGDALDPLLVEGEGERLEVKVVGRSVDRSGRRRVCNRGARQDQLLLG